MYIDTYMYICVFVEVCKYTFAASDDADDFPVFENKIEGSKQLDPCLSSFCFTVCTLRENFADLMEKQIFSKRIL